ncbi:MAG: DTW domain-containing protein [Pseudomonadales bacterium]|nr:DTW domain-containing protein [Pseudomonadales bacterium]
MKLFLLTHQRETLKKTNTGQLVQQELQQDCETLIWHRKQPDKRLEALVEQGKIALLYPGEQASSAETFLSFEHFVIIDSTWQQAQKMMNQSPYLQAMPKVSLAVSTPSRYILRRNQKAQGLCTAEVAIELLSITQQPQKSDALKTHFQRFNQRP